MSQTTQPKFETRLAQKLYAEGIEKTDCPKCLVEQLYELERLLAKIESHSEGTHRCFV